MAPALDLHCFSKTPDPTFFTLGLSKCCNACCFSQNPSEFLPTLWICNSYPFTKQWRSWPHIHRVYIKSYMQSARISLQCVLLPWVTASCHGVMVRAWLVQYWKKNYIASFRIPEKNTQMLVYKLHPCQDELVVENCSYYQSENTDSQVKQKQEEQRNKQMTMGTDKIQKREKWEPSTIRLW